MGRVPVAYGVARARRPRRRRRRRADRAAFALSGDDARLGERRAAEAEAAAEAARLEVRATATRLETILNEGITESRDDDETRREHADVSSAYHAVGGGGFGDKSSLATPKKAPRRGRSRRTSPAR